MKRNKREKLRRISIYEQQKFAKCRQTLVALIKEYENDRGQVADEFVPIILHKLSFKNLRLMAKNITKCAAPDYIKELENAIADELIARTFKLEEER